MKTLIVKYVAMNHGKTFLNEQSNEMSCAQRDVLTIVDAHCSIVIDFNRHSKNGCCRSHTGEQTHRCGKNLSHSRGFFSEENRLNERLLSFFHWQPEILRWMFVWIVEILDKLQCRQRK